MKLPSLIKIIAEIDQNMFKNFARENTQLVNYNFNVDQILFYLKYNNITVVNAHHA